MSAITGLFSAPKPPAPQPVPVNPMNDAAAQQKRDEAARMAQADRLSRGRASTVSAGGDIAMEDQALRGAGFAQRRQAARTILG